MPLSRDAAPWELRLLIGVDAPDDATIEFHRRGYERLEDMRLTFMRTAEARRLFDAANPVPPDTNAKPFMIPAFLRQPELRGD